ncbi:MAG: response regulator [Bacteroidota bacterium]
MIKTIIVDDEEHCTDSLMRLINASGDALFVVAKCTSVRQAKDAIVTLNPDVVFLDVHLENETGFELLEQLPKIDFELIFTTAFDTYAVEAFRFSALDYLLKPIAASDFATTITKIKQKIGLKDTAKKLEILFHNFEERTDGLKKIAVPTVDGITFLSILDIEVI